MTPPDRQDLTWADIPTAPRSEPPTELDVDLAYALAPLHELLSDLPHILTASEAH